jgi:hypothetical protein
MSLDEFRDSDGQMGKLYEERLKPLRMNLSLRFPKGPKFDLTLDFSFQNFGQLPSLDQ